MSSHKQRAGHSGLLQGHCQYLSAINSNMEIATNVQFTLAAEDPNPYSVYQNN